MYHILNYKAKAMIKVIESGRDRNIVITLPRHLIVAILSGKKLYEVRKRAPKDIIPGRTKVYMVEKGKKLVRGYFVLGGFLSIVDAGAAWYHYGSKLAISEEWFIDYAAGADELKFWIVQDVRDFIIPYFLDVDFRISRNPQCYVYTDINL